MSNAEFLVNIRFTGTERMTPEEHEALVVKERAHAAELVKQGHLVRMWRVPGRRENWGLWRAKDATHLHAIISALPFWPFMEVAVHAVARHPVDPLRDATY